MEATGAEEHIDMDDEFEDWLCNGWNQLQWLDYALFKEIGEVKAPIFQNFLVES